VLFFLLLAALLTATGRSAEITPVFRMFDDNYALGQRNAVIGSMAQSWQPTSEGDPLTEPDPEYLDPGALPSLTLAQVFDGRPLNPELEASLDPTKFRTIIATGDLIPARMVDVVVQQQKNDFTYPVNAIKKITAAADLTFSNLESPLMKSCTPRSDGMTFCGRTGFTKMLTALGVDVATLENNHIGNYGDAGIKETRKLLDANGIKWANRKTPAIVDLDGIKFGFLAFNGVGESVDVKAMQKKIKELRPQVDVVVVAFHWGAEYVRSPESAGGVAPQDPRKLARQAIDAGADLIQGNHPHWPQAFETYKGKLISYALGNTVFDQMWSLETRQGLIATYRFYGSKLLDVRLTPTLIENYAKPVPMKSKDAAALIKSIRKASEQLAKKK
jgi:poly-gamma-glutamate synthesis protein (capsule biosynthesis protein)